MNIHSLPRHPRSPPARQTRRSVKDVSGQSVKDVMGLNTLKSKGAAPALQTKPSGLPPNKPSAGRAELQKDLKTPFRPEGRRALGSTKQNTRPTTQRTTQREAPPQEPQKSK